MHNLRLCCVWWCHCCSFSHSQLPLPSPLPLSSIEIAFSAAGLPHVSVAHLSIGPASRSAPPAWTFDDDAYEEPVADVANYGNAPTSLYTQSAVYANVPQVAPAAVSPAAVYANSPQKAPSTPYAVDHTVTGETSNSQPPDKALPKRTSDDDYYDDLPRRALLRWKTVCEKTTTVVRLPWRGGLCTLWREKRRECKCAACEKVRSLNTTLTPTLFVVCACTYIRRSGHSRLALHREV